MNAEVLQQLAEKVGTPFWVCDAALLNQRIAAIKRLTEGKGLQARYAMKACPATRILKEMLEAGIWIDAVSGNEVLRARRAGFPGSSILYTSDVFRDGAIAILREHGVMPNLGSPGMLRELQETGYAGPISLRVNPGFGHGHVNACDTGGPSSKHGIWFSDIHDVAMRAERFGMTVTMLHAHIGSGPKFPELLDNMRRLAKEFAGFIPKFPKLTAVSLGGGIPHNYRDAADQPSLEPLRAVLEEARASFCSAAERDIRLEIEPGRYLVAPAVTLVARVTDVKRTETNERGKGETFVMVDAGFTDLVRPAMYGSFHRITIAGRHERDGMADVVVAGPLCESGDVFTRDGQELLVPRRLPTPHVGDLLLLHDAGAYGYAMSSNYNSLGRAPQLMLEEDGSVTMFSRRETVDDLLATESNEKIS
ncbi:MAG TPA: diaminopimelate decarboxylase [Verrucomicrobiae bacterium]|nr:diaminopimelate decarboxylase [Verrucomicrobiae bacterium]